MYIYIYILVQYVPIDIGRSFRDGVDGVFEGCTSKIFGRRSFRDGADGVFEGY